MNEIHPIIPDPSPDRAFEQHLREMNEVLFLSSIRQHELAEKAQQSNLLAVASEERLRRNCSELRLHLDELSRFNRAAVGRELRVIELKNEVNELRRRQGEIPRYPLACESEAGPSYVETNAVAMAKSAFPLEPISCVEDLSLRPVRRPDYEAENRALASLIQALADSPRTILQTLADTILDSFHVNSAGVSLLSDDGLTFNWPAISGVWKPYIGGGTPRNFGPCGDVLDHDGPLLFSHPERRYPYLLSAVPAVEECLLVPFRVGGKAVGTIWAIIHDVPRVARRFDAEDLRQLESLGRFASAACQSVDSFRAIEQHRAALSLMEDSIQSRQLVETLNRQLRGEIAERQQAEEMLRRSEQRLQFIMDSAPQKIFTATPKGEMTYFNSQWMEFTGLSLDLIIGWGWTQFVHPDDLIENIRAWSRSLDTGEPFHLERRFRNRDGEYRWHLSRAQPMRDADGMILMWVGSDTDIHEVKEADRRKNEFLAVLAHELRNPLAPIRNGVQILRLTDGKQESIRAISAMMERQVAQMVRLVDDLLDVSRITRGKIDLRRERIELTPSINHAVEAARSLYENMEQELIVTLPPSPIYLNADSARLAQVVGNLLNNACKFTDQHGRIWLTVGLEGEQAVIRVRDSGVGIVAAQLSRIFDMFVQIDTTLERSVSGLGIGLTLVKNLVEMHGGQVEVHSAGIGCGSEFVVRLPIISEMASPPPSPPINRLMSTTATRFLVVDDNCDSANSLAQLLKLTGGETQIAYDGWAAIGVAEAFLPHVILLDIGLPKVSGLETCRRIRQQSWGQNIVIIALTGWGQDDDRRKSRDAGFNGHLVKPVDHAVLTKMLAELLPIPD